MPRSSESPQVRSIKVVAFEEAVPKAHESWQGTRFYLPVVCLRRFRFFGPFVQTEIVVNHRKFGDGTLFVKGVKNLGGD